MPNILQTTQFNQAIVQSQKTSDSCCWLQRLVFFFVTKCGVLVTILTLEYRIQISFLYLKQNSWAKWTQQGNSYIAINQCREIVLSPDHVLLRATWNALSKNFKRLARWVLPKLALFCFINTRFIHLIILLECFPPVFPEQLLN